MIPTISEVASNSERERAGRTRQVSPVVEVDNGSWSERRHALPSPHGIQRLLRGHGVARDAAQDEIKRAYRKLARKYHPTSARRRTPRPGSRRSARPTRSSRTRRSGPPTTASPAAGGRRGVPAAAGLGRGFRVQRRRCRSGGRQRLQRLFESLFGRGRAVAPAGPADDLPGARPGPSREGAGRPRGQPAGSDPRDHPAHAGADRRRPRHHAGAHPQRAHPAGGAQRAADPARGHGGRAWQRPAGRPLPGVELRPHPLYGWTAPISTWTCRSRPGRRRSARPCRCRRRQARST